jgi:hypothetical protein
MLTANPWVVYFSVITPLLAAYYLLVGFIFYRHDLKSRISRWKSPPIRAVAFPSGNVHREDLLTQDHSKAAPELTANHANQEDQDQSQQPWENEVMMQQLEELSIHLKQAIEEAHDKDYNKEELVLLVQMILKEYPTIYGTPFQLSVNDMIETECAKYGSIHLDGEDRRRMWNQAD